jgi:hypothetical protein
MIENPKYLLDNKICSIKAVVDIPNKTIKAVFASFDGTYPQYDRLMGHVATVQLSKHLFLISVFSE